MIRLPVAYDARMLEFDHVIVAVEDLLEASDLFLDRYGLASVEGGRHVGHGTANRLIPLGPDYLELVAVVDPEEASGSPFGSWVADAATAGLRGLCLRTPGLDSTAQRLGLDVIAMSRVRPDGYELRWRLAGMEALARGLPFFIDWDVDSEHHPGAALAGHRGRSLGLAWVEIGGDPQVFHSWIGPSELDIRTAGGTPGVKRIAVATQSGELIV